MNEPQAPVVASNELLAEKCIIHGCLNRKGEGRFDGDICSPCFRAITTGIVGPSTSFIFDMRDGLMDILSREDWTSGECRRRSRAALGMLTANISREPRGSAPGAA